MGAPVIAAAALTTRTGRRILTGVLVGILLVVGFLITPLVAIPFAIAGAAGNNSRTTDAAPVASGDWGYPLAGRYFKGRGFGWNPVHGCSFCSKDHKGYDMSQGCGSTIYAAGPGTVVHAGGLGGWGNTVRIEHRDGLHTLYAHMQWGSINVSVDQQVVAGTPLGAEGRTGNSTGCHLHFEVQDGWTAVPTEPFMAALGLPLT